MFSTIYLHIYNIYLYYIYKYIYICKHIHLAFSEHIQKVCFAKAMSFATTECYFGKENFVKTRLCDSDGSAYLQNHLKAWNG